jgi:hypothetical protein
VVAETSSRGGASTAGLSALPASGVTARSVDTTEKIGTFSALRLRDFRLLLVGTTLSNAAQWIQQVTMGWLVYDLTGSGTALGTVNLVRSAASLSLTPGPAWRSTAWAVVRSCWPRRPGCSPSRSGSGHC